jgi:quercetin dioxygenase-like cupin family protein
VTARHTHPGVESAYMIEGGTELSIDGVGRLTLKAGGGYHVAAGAPHGGKNGPQTVIAATCVVEQGKPPAAPA